VPGFGSVQIARAGAMGIVLADAGALELAQERHLGTGDWIVQWRGDDSC
jgi:hypothetical protein